MSNLVIPDGGNIGSASDTDAISIASNGKATFSQGIANCGTIEAGTIGASVTKKIHGFSAYLSSSANVPSSATTFTELGGSWGGTWTERWDSHNHFASGRFTPTVQGVYLFGYSCGSQLLDQHERMKGQIRKNGSTSAGDIGGHTYDWSFDSSDYTLHLTGSTLMQLDTDDYASFWYLQESGDNAQPFVNLTEFWGCLIGTV